MESSTKQGDVPYAELHCRSNFSFLQGASHPEQLVEQARAVGLRALALTDRNGLYGIVRFSEAARALGLPTVFGAELQCGTAGDVHAEHRERTRYIERYLQPFIMHLYVHVWNLNRPVFFVSGVLLCEAPQRELYDCGAHVMALAAEIVFEMPSFDRRPWEME